MTDQISKLLTSFKALMDGFREWTDSACTMYINWR